MIDLKRTLAREEVWLELAGEVRVRVRPISSALMLSARQAGFAPSESEESLYQRMLVALATAAITEWEGVTLDGALAPLTPENLEALFSLWPLFRAFEDQYYAPALRLDAEKNS